MSQTSDPIPAELTLDQLNNLLSEKHKARHNAGLSCGPVYNEAESNPVVWFDQQFGTEITPSGSYECPIALATGSTQNSLDVILVASHSNTAVMNIPAGATITLTMSASDDYDGPYAATGPSVCVTAPAGGIAVEPCGLACRFAIGNIKKRWMKCKLVFSGNIAPGKLDCALGYIPR